MNVPAEMPEHVINEILLLNGHAKLIEGGYVNGALWPRQQDLPGRLMMWLRRNNKIYALVDTSKKPPLRSFNC